MLPLSKTSQAVQPKRIHDDLFTLCPHSVWIANHIIRSIFSDPLRKVFWTLHKSKCLLFLFCITTCVPRKTFTTQKCRDQIQDNILSLVEKKKKTNPKGLGIPRLHRIFYHNWYICLLQVKNDFFPLSACFRSYFSSLFLLGCFILSFSQQTFT